MIAGSEDPAHNVSPPGISVPGGYFLYGMLNYLP